MSIQSDSLFTPKVECCCTTSQSWPAYLLLSSFLPGEHTHRASLIRFIRSQHWKWQQGQHCRVKADITWRPLLYKIKGTGVASCCREHCYPSPNSSDAKSGKNIDEFLHNFFLSNWEKWFWFQKFFRIFCEMTKSHFFLSNQSAKSGKHILILQVFPDILYSRQIEK